MGGSITSEELKQILERAGFMPYTIVEEDLTPEYLNKWGHENMEHYIRRGKILAIKPNM
ncbi:MAG: hypothetical protein MSH08_01840 [Ezakiella sp.]|nr:hypothetical protein [Ezakiella sp.]MDD7472205.1 hypothetical protein [Bacillota bacterium]MDY3923198.1 hypothetical protein [Ezakiella sp.]